MIEDRMHEGKLERVIRVNVGDGRITLSEVGDNENYLTVMTPVGHTTVEIDATQLRGFGADILALFGDKAVCADDQHDMRAKMHAKIFEVLVDNEARCLDDNIDRDFVLARLLEALAP